MTTTLTTESSAIVSDGYLDDYFDGDLEKELEDPQGRIENPFDPEQIKIRTVNIVVEQLTARIRYGEIDLTPDFQRLRGIWTDQRKSRLIESLLLRIPIPVFYVASDESEIWSVVDGVQRMSTIDDYVTGKFNLTGLEYLTWLNERKHADLPRRLQRRISETQLIVNVIEPGTPDEVMLNVFLRINTGGMQLKEQEIRHALNPGPVRGYLKDLAESDEFIKATNGSVKPTRMADREFVLRFLSFHTSHWKNYDARGFDSYLGKIMKDLNKMDQDLLDNYERDFKKAMNAAYKIFRDDAFRKPSGRNKRRGSVNRALFETWSVELARRSPEEIAMLVRHSRKIQSRFRRLMREDSEFVDAISYSTATRQRVQKRFSAIQNLVGEFV